MDIGGEFGFGVDDLLSIVLNGTDRNTEYGAVNAGAANLWGGDLEVAIGFALTEQNYIFKLILSSAIDGIPGDFANVSVIGLDPSYSYTAGAVLEDLGGRPTEIYRLTLNQRAAAAPEPHALVLLTLGLGAFGLAGRRRTERRKTV